MNWTELTALVPVEQVDTAAAIANLVVPYGIAIEDYSDLEQAAWEIAHIDLIDEELVAKDRTKARIRMYFPEEENVAEAMAFLKERMAAAAVDFRLETELVDDSDWNENWKKYFKAFEIGEKLAVCPSWETYENTENRRVIALDPGAAFGTGSHATTYLCLTLLESLITDTATVLDIGTGSGILAVAAALLGAEKAVGVDIDPLSVQTATENAARNGVSDRTEFAVGDLAEQVSGQYDLICANIVADVILRLFDTVEAYRKPNGYLLVSGIIDSRAAEIEEAAAAHGYRTVRACTREEWHAYLLTK